MPKRIPTVGTVVIRDGKRVRPEINKPFDYTKEEIEGIAEGSPTALRMPTKDDEGDAAPAATTTRTAEASQAKARGGKKAATAATADSEAEAGDTDPPADGSPAPKGAGSDDDL